MRDKIARGLIEELADRLGCVVLDDNGDIHIRPASADGNDEIAELFKKASGLNADVSALKIKLTALETKYADLEQKSLPVCPTCGQRVQNGFKFGDIEKVSAAVRKANKK